jgi:hypothetical protein
LISLPFARIAAALVVGVLLQACGSLPRLDAVPPTLTERAVIPGILNSRFWLDRDLAPFIQAALQDNERERTALAKAGKTTDPCRPQICWQFRAAATPAHSLQDYWPDGARRGLDPSSLLSRASARAL